MFETEKEVLDWYERQARSVTKAFTDDFPWAEVKHHQLNPAFIPVLLYMRDVESFTDIYYREALRTPTGKDPIIRRFMERWVVEEADHGDILNRFLSEAGVPVELKWQTRVKAAIPLSYSAESYISTCVTNVFGKSSTATHMVWGAINEFTTLQGYRCLSAAAEHPLLTRILSMIVREESAHANFYWQIARLRLLRSRFAQGLARFAVKNFWTPVGQGAKPANETDYVISTLFAGQPGVSFFDKNVSQKVERLPGLDGLKTITDRIERISSRRVTLV